MVNLPLWNWACIVVFVATFGFSWWRMLGPAVRDHRRRLRTYHDERRKEREAELAAMWNAHERRSKS